MFASLLPTGGGAKAQSGLHETAALREALSAIPQSRLRADRSPTVVFGDVGQALAASGKLDGNALRRVMSAASEVRALQFLNYGKTVAAWNAATGIDLASVRYFAGIGTPPETLDVWGLATPEAGEAVLARLRSGGFEAVSSAAAGWSVVANGKDFAQGPARMDPSSPWAGPLGRTSVVAVKGGQLFHAAGRGLISELTAADRTLADDPSVDTALAGLEKRVAGGRLVGAHLFFPETGVMLGDAGAASGTAPENASPAASLPSYALAILADVQVAGRPALIASLAYPDCDIARTAAEGFATAWTAWAADAAETRISAEAVHGAGSGCAATALVEAQGAGEPRNRFFEAAYKGIMTRDFPPLRIARP